MGALAGRRITVHATRYDGSFRDRLEGVLLDAPDGVFRVRSHEGTLCDTPGGPVAEVTDSTQVYFADRWYNVNHLHRVVAPYRNFWYTNIAMPAELHGDGLRWVDLVLDVMLDVERGILLKDVELFEQRATNGYYPKHIVERVYAARDEVLALARAGEFPFDRDVQIAG